MTDWERARDVARDLRRALGEPEDPDALLEAAVEAEGLRLRARPAGDPLLAGAHAVLDPEARTIWIRSDLPAPQRRLILAHEIGHCRLHHAPSECRCDEADLLELPELAGGYGPRQRRETEANAFAREFLLPAQLAQRRFREEEVDAHTIARDAGVVDSVAFAQLALAGALVESPIVDASLPALDSSQIAAASAPTGPLLVGAGPGTGKTRTLTARVLYLTRERGIAPENLLALTFSRKAAEEMRERIAAVAPEVSARAAITTFHAYGLDLLRRHYGAAGLPPQPVLLTEAEAFALLERRMAALPLDALRFLHDPAFPLPDILRAIARAKEALQSPDEIARRAEAASDPKWRDVAIVYAEYERLLAEHGAIDFADLVSRPIRLLEGNPTILTAERTAWRQVLVDEYQDVNRAGARLVQLLTGPDGAGLWAVGDLRQAIYAFRGASPANVARFHEDFPTGRYAELAVNYRSRPGLVALFGVVSGDGPDHWQAHREGEAQITLGVAEDDSAQAVALAGRMQEFADAGIAWQEMAVLCRTRNQARALRTALLAEGIPIAASPDDGAGKGMALFAQPDVRRLIALIAIAADPHAPERHLWQEPPSGLEDLPRDPHGLLAEALWGPMALARTATDPGAIARLLLVARSFQERSSILVEPGDDPRQTFLAHLRRLARLGAPLGDNAAASESSPCVRVMTAHASKGLEFSVVYVPNLSVGKFPSRPAPSLLPPLPSETATDDADAEEERLFFVALTRARDHLVLSRADRYGRFAAAPSPLLARLRGGSIAIQRWRKTRPPASAPEAPDTREPDHRPRVSAADAELYARCPKRFEYERRLRLAGNQSSLYETWKRTIRVALSDDADDALERSWQEHGPADNHPAAALYRTVAEKVVANYRALASGQAPTTAQVDLQQGTIVVRADAIAADGQWERRTLRRPPEEASEAVEPEMRLTLLQRAAEEQGAAVVVRYLQTGAALPVADKPRQRAKHVAAYERALRGIALDVFPATPADTADCPACPFFFVCPE